MTDETSTEQQASQADNQDANTTNQDWRSYLPENVRDWDETKTAETPEAFWKRLSDQRSHIGNSIRIPSVDASDSDWSEFHDKILNRVPALMRAPNGSDEPEVVDTILKTLGKPDDAKRYEFPEGDNAMPEDSMNFLKESALKAGLTQAQFKTLSAELVQQTNNATNEAQQSLANELEAISNEWGLASEAKYKQTYDFAKNTGAPEDLLKQLENRQVDARTVFWLETLAHESNESDGGHYGGDSTANTGAMTPYEAQMQITDILNNPKHPYHDRENNGPAREHMHKLMKYANPNTEYSNKF